MPIEDDPHNEVSVVDYDPDWIASFEQQRDIIVAALQSAGHTHASVEHVGSTAVPGLAAKPIIDIMVCFDRLPALESTLELLAAIGYLHVPKPEFTESYFFRYGETFEGTIHLHLTPVTSEFGLQMLRFRDALRASPNLAADYAAWPNNSRTTAPPTPPPKARSSPVPPLPNSDRRAMAARLHLVRWRGRRRLGTRGAWHVRTMPITIVISTFVPGPISTALGKANRAS